MIHLLCLNWYSPTMRNSSNTKLTNRVWVQSAGSALVGGRDASTSNPAQTIEEATDPKSKWKTGEPTSQPFSCDGAGINEMPKNKHKSRSKPITSDYGPPNSMSSKGYWVFTASISLANRSVKPAERALHGIGVCLEYPWRIIIIIT